MIKQPFNDWLEAETYAHQLKRDFSRASVEVVIYVISQGQGKETRRFDNWYQAEEYAKEQKKKYPKIKIRTKIWVIAK